MARGWRFHLSPVQDGAVVLTATQLSVWWPDWTGPRLLGRLREGRIKSLETLAFAGDSRRFPLVFLHGASPRKSPPRSRSADRNGARQRGQDRGLAGDDRQAEDDHFFGARSEKSVVIIAEQLSLALGAIEAGVAAPTPANDDGQNAERGNEIAPETRKKRNRNIGALPKHLPRVDVTIEPETTTCPLLRGPTSPHRRRLQRRGRSGSGGASDLAHDPPKYACRPARAQWFKPRRARA